MTKKIYTKDIDLSYLYITKLPEWLKEIDIVHGDVNLSHNMLEDLENCPKIIDGSLICSFNKLKSLKGCPQQISGRLLIDHNSLTSLKGLEHLTFVREFNCSFNKLKSLEGAPVSAGIFICQSNSNTRQFTKEEVLQHIIVPHTKIYL